MPPMQIASRHFGRALRRMSLSLETVRREWEELNKPRPPDNAPRS